MGLRSLPLLVTAVVFGLIAAAWSVLSGGDDTRLIVVAVGDIHPGVPIKAGQLRIVAWPSGGVPAGNFAKMELVVGRVARQPIIANEPVVEARLARRDARGGLSALIAPGMRAISVRVDEVIGVAGFALPGEYVDVIVSARDASSAPFSRIVLSRVKVVAAEQDTAGDPTQPKVVRAVTLELGPEDAEKLDLARNIGSLSLVLRNELDTRQTASRGVRLNDILPRAGSGVAATPGQPSAAGAGQGEQLRAAGSSAAPVAPVPSALVAQPAAVRAVGRGSNGYGAEEIRGASASGRGQ